MHSVWTKTEAGQQAFKQRSTQLSGKLRSAFLLFDGQRTVEQVLEATQGLGVGWEDLSGLLESGMLQAAVTVAPPPLAPAAMEQPEQAAAADAQQDMRSPQVRYRDAYPVAVALTGKLGLSGFRLNLAVEAATSYEDLVAVAPKIKEAVGAQAFEPLEQALFA